MTSLDCRITVGPHGLHGGHGLLGGHAIGWHGRGRISPWPNAAEGRSRTKNIVIAERIVVSGLATRKTPATNGLAHGQKLFVYAGSA